MGYQVIDCSGTPEETEEIASFLAAFVADGEGGEKDPLGRLPETWRSRLNWWWVTNPYRRPDSPLGFILRCESGQMVGFFGFIPHDYIIGGIRVPSLISTTTFVRKDCREAALGLFLRSHRLREKFHLVDGGPNAEAQALLERTGYSHAEKGKVYLYPVRRLSLHPGSLLLQAARFITPDGTATRGSGHLVTTLEEVKSVPPIHDHRLRKHVDRESLAWYLNSGSKKKHFIGWCDGDGTLRCYLHGITRKRLGLTVFVVMDDGFFEPEDALLLNELVASAAHNPRAAGMPKEVDLLAWPTATPVQSRRPSPFAVSYDVNLFYRLPSPLADAERHCQPYEGDKSLL